jgi:hypothetical protein
LDGVHRELSPGYTEWMLALAARCIDDEATTRQLRGPRGQHELWLSWTKRTSNAGSTR